MFFNFDFKKVFFIFLAIILPLLSINMEHRPQESQWLARPFSYVLSSIEGAFFGFSNGVKSTTSQYLDLIKIKTEIQRLKSQNETLMAQMQKMEDLHLENDRLKELLQFKKSTKMDLIAAQVIGKDLIPDHKTLTINKGLNDGLKPGMAVITKNGALGYVFKPQTYISQIMLLTDRYAVVDSLIQRTRAKGLVEGDGQKTCQLKYLDKSEDVQVGDIVVTGDLDQIFPKGLPLGIVQNVERKEYEVSMKITLRPSVDENKVEEVFIITNTQNEIFETTPPLVETQ